MIRHLIKLTTHREFRSFYASILMILLLLIGALQYASLGSLGRLLDKQIFHPLVFSLREWVRPPSLDSRIKILAFDDRAASFEGKPDISLNDWIKTLNALAKPHVSILIDKLFDFYGKKSQDLNVFKEGLAKEKRTNATIGVISFAADNPINYRQKIPEKTLQGNLKRIFTTTADWQSSQMKQGPEKIFYGADPVVLESFDLFGHANYRGDHYVDPLFWSQENLLPHITFALAGHLKFSEGRLYSNEQIIPRNQRQQTLVNFQNPEVYKARSMTLLAALERSRRGQPIDIINPGDYVVILPAMYTGHTDFVSSPFGPIPGGFHLVALLNSLLTNQWIREIEDPGIFVILGAGLGLFLGFTLYPSIASGAIFLGLLGFSAVSVAMFSFLSLAWSFILPASAFLLSGMTAILIRGHMTSVENYRRQQELEVAGLVQKSFFPNLNLNADSSLICAVYGRFQPASECGGDWWGSFKIGGFTYVLMGDAIGHGVPAALVTSISYAVGKSLEAEIQISGIPLRPSEILFRLNSILCSMSSTYSQMTFIVFRIHDQSGSCLYANGGNQPPYLLAGVTSSVISDDSLGRFLPSQGNLLGELHGESFKDYDLTLSIGEKLVFYTDGIFENRDEKERGQLGKKWLRATFHKHASKHGKIFIEAVWQEYIKAIGSTPPDDDVTLVVVEYAGP